MHNSHLAGLPVELLDVQKSQQILLPKSASFEKQYGTKNPYGLLPTWKNANNCHTKLSEEIKLSVSPPSAGTAAPLPLSVGQVSS